MAALHTRRRRIARRCRPATAELVRPSASFPALWPGLLRPCGRGGRFWCAGRRACRAAVAQQRAGRPAAAGRCRRKGTPAPLCGIGEIPTQSWPCAAGLAGSLGRSGRGAAKSSDPVGVAGRQKLLGVAFQKVSYTLDSPSRCWISPNKIPRPLGGGQISSHIKSTKTRNPAD